MKDKRVERTDGSGRQSCVHCWRRSLPGMTKGRGLCPYHWAVWVWGRAWADSIFLPEVKR
jgi:hypothetical protein